MQAGTLSVLPRGPQWWGLEGDGAAGLVGPVVVVQRLQHAHPGLHLVLRGRGQQEHSLGRMYRKHVRVQCPGREGGRWGGGEMSKQYNNTLQSFFGGGGGGGGERLKAGSQYDAGPCVTSVYIFLRNTSDAGIEPESIRVLCCVPYATLE